MGGEVGGLLELGAGADAFEVAFDGDGFVEASSVSEVDATGEVLFQSQFQVYEFMTLYVQPIFSKRSYNFQRRI